MFDFVVEQELGVLDSSILAGPENGGVLLFLIVTKHTLPITYHLIIIHSKCVCVFARLFNHAQYLTWKSFVISNKNVAYSKQ